MPQLPQCLQRHVRLQANGSRGRFPSGPCQPAASQAGKRTWRTVGVDLELCVCVCAIIMRHAVWRAEAALHRFSWSLRRSAHLKLLTQTCVPTYVPA